jgi:hypothetical protein
MVNFRWFRQSCCLYCFHYSFVDLDVLSCFIGLLLWSYLHVSWLLADSLYVHPTHLQE